jgi:hypothetical protein
MEQKQMLREPDIKPTSNVLEQGLGTAYKTFIKFTADLKCLNITLMDWRYYNDGKAWLSKGEYKWTTPRGTHKVKPIFWLSIWDGFFKISFFFADSFRTVLQDLPISQAVKKSITDARKMGKTMRFFPLIIDVKTDKQLKDVYTIAEYKSRC